MTRSGGFVERNPGFGVLVVGLGTLVVPFDSSVNVAFPHIIRGFDLAIPSIQWVVITYTLTYSNPGTSPIDGVVINDTVPAGVSFVAGSMGGSPSIPVTSMVGNEFSRAW